MTNAIIVDKILGTSENGLFCQIMFQVNVEDKTQTISTMPIYLLSPGETNEHSSAAVVLQLILDTIEVKAWEDLVGKAAQIDFNEDGVINTIGNIINPKKVLTFGVIMNEESEESAEPTEITEAESE